MKSLNHLNLFNPNKTIVNILLIKISFSSPFKVNPVKGFLNVQESLLLNVTFESAKLGEVTSKLYLILETGEKLTVMLHGSAENASIRLEKNSLMYEDTFHGLKRCKTVRLFNNSSSVVKYSWKKNKFLEDDKSMIEK